MQITQGEGGLHISNCGALLFAPHKGLNISTMWRGVFLQNRTGEGGLNISTMWRGLSVYKKYTTPLVCCPFASVLIHSQRIFFTTRKPLDSLWSNTEAHAWIPRAKNPDATFDFHAKNTRASQELPWCFCAVPAKIVSFIASLIVFILLHTVFIVFLCSFCCLWYLLRRLFYFLRR